MTSPSTRQRVLLLLAYCLFVVLALPCAADVPPVGPAGPVGGTSPGWTGGRQWGRTPEEKRRAPPIPQAGPFQLSRLQGEGSVRSSAPSATPK